MKVVSARGHVPLPRQNIGTCVAVFISRQIIGVKISGASFPTKSLLVCSGLKVLPFSSFLALAEETKSKHVVNEFFKVKLKSLHISTVRNPHKRTCLFIVQADFVLIHRELFVKST